MKIICEKESLEQVVIPVAKIINAKTVSPILENILLEAMDQQLRVVATDLEIGMEKRINVKVEQEGVVTVPAKLFAEVISNLEDGILEITLLEDGKLLEVKGANFIYKFNALPANEFPLLPDVIKLHSISLNEKILREAIKDTVFAAAPASDTNVVLTCLCFKVENGNLIMVASDGRRLAKKTLNIGSNVDFKVSVLVPVKALNELIRVLGDSDEQVDTVFGKSQIMFKGNSFSFFSRLVDGEFPVYENIFSSKRELNLKLERDDFLSTLKRVVIFAQEKDSPKLIKIRTSSDKIIITANTQDLGQAYEEVKCDGKIKAELLVGFNAKFLIDVLSTLSCSSVYFELSNSLEAGVIKPADQNGYQYIVMPVKTN